MSNLNLCLVCFQEGVSNERLVKDWNDVASENQKRMNSNPFEVILMNMGYRIGGNREAEGSDDEPAAGEPRDRRGVQCNPT
jgi:WD and tetratricopeptide repeat-containing protein 1